MLRRTFPRSGVCASSRVLARWNIHTLADFIQSQPFAGQPSRERTEGRFLYDDNNLYIGVICFDSEVRQMVVNDLRDDFNFAGTDGISIIIDSLHDRRSGFQFGTNPAGARRDSQITNDGTYGDDWDGAWDVKVTRNDEGWIAEFQIPFKTLRFSKSTSQEWGVNVNRRILRLNENSNWSPIPVRYGISRVSLAGVLQGLENIHQGRNLKIKPFVTAAFTEARQNQASISFVIDQTFDRLTRDDQVLGVSIPRGDYKYHSYSANASTDRRRRIGGNGRFTWGDFWDGARTSFDSAVNLRPTYRWNIDLIYSRNRVALMSGRGATDLFGTRLVYGFSPHAFFNAFVQYNAATQRLSSNLRFNWIHHPLSDLYVVYNDTRDTATGQRVDRALIIKFTNLFNF